MLPFFLLSRSWDSPSPSLLSVSLGTGPEAVSPTLQEALLGSGGGSPPTLSSCGQTPPRVQLLGVSLSCLPSLPHSWAGCVSRNCCLECPPGCFSVFLFLKNIYVFIRDPLAAQTVKSLPTMWDTRVQFLGWEDPLEKEMATHSSILAWRIPWMEEPGGLQSIVSQRAGHD